MILAIRGLTLVLNSRIVRFWITVTVASLLAYDLYWLIDGLVGQGYYIGFGMVVNAFKQLFGISTGLSTIWVVGHALGFIGLVIRFIGLTLALYLIFLMWKLGKSFSSVKKRISVAVFLEAAFFLCLSFSVVMLQQSGQDILASSYFLQIVLIAPLMIALSDKLWKTQNGFTSISTLKWIDFAFLGYTAAIGVSSISRWVVYAQYFNNQVFPSGSALLGFINSVVCMFLALAFAIAGSFLLLKTKNHNLATKSFGVSLFALGTHFLGYLIYAYLTGSLGLVMLWEIWAIPLLGLGVSLFYVAGHRNSSLS